MTNTEQQYFKELSEKRQRDSEVFMDQEYINLFKGVIDKYSDQAHFIYELLQNADDAKATKVYIKLFNTGVIFKHNGENRFNVSNPKTAANDRLNGKLGSVNSITAIGFSTKTGGGDSDIKIGKFGVGFKSVFQYTNTPHIYDGNISFKIEKYIVPTLLSDDSILGKVGDKETIIFLPFNKDVPEKSFRDISEKLNELDNPILFLHNLEEIEFEIEGTGTKRKYTKHIEKTSDIAEKTDVQCELLDISNNGDAYKLWMFTRNIEIENEKFPISIGYKLKDAKIDTDWKPKIFCFFPTKETLDLCFVMHAPFDLVDSRENIKQKNDINKTLFEELAKLAATSLLCMKKIGENDKTYLLNDNILDIVPLKDPDKHTWTRLGAFYDSCVEVIKERKLLITSTKTYIGCRKAVYVGKKNLRDIVGKKQINELYENEYHESPNFDYVFTTKVINNDAKKTYIKDVLNITEFDDSAFCQNITSDFMIKQSDNWLIQFYRYLCNQKLLEKEFGTDHPSQLYTYTYSYKKQPILKLESGDFAAAGSVYLPCEGFDDCCDIVNKELYEKSEDFRKLLVLLEIKEPDRDVFIKNILYSYNEYRYSNKNITIEKETILKDIESLYLYYRDIRGSNEKEEFIRKVSDSILIVGNDKNLLDVSDLYVNTKELHIFFEGLDDIEFVNESYYKDLSDKYDDFSSFMGKLDFRKVPKIKEITVQWYNFSRTDDIDTNNKYGWVDDYEMEGLSSFPIDNMENSILLWNFLSAIEGLRDYIKAYHKYQPDNDGRKKVQQEGECDSDFIYLLKTTPWLYDKSGELKNISEISIEDLNDKYPENAELINILGINHSIIESLPQEIKDDAKWGNKAKCCFESVEEMQEASLFFKKKKEQEREKREAAAEAEAIKNQSKLSRNSQKDKKGGDPSNLFSKDELVSSESKQERENLIKNVHENIKKRREKEDEQLEQLEQLEKKSETAEKYSVAWFRSLLELEYLKSGEENYGKKALKISFGNIQLENKRIVVLGNPSRYIPNSLEEENDIEVIFYFKDKDKKNEKISFEVANVKDYSLRLKCKAEDEERVSDIIRQKPIRSELLKNKPIGLIDEMRKAFDNLNFDDETYSLKDNINKRLEFVFGPPGTGKTTYLSERITNIIKDKDSVKILVLAPTNKACDVLTSKLLDKNKEDNSWICRFVATGDTRLEDEEVICQRELPITKVQKVCVISTMARFPYDGFDDAKLDEVKWDCIIIDEASMIPLVYMVYSLYKCPDSQFIVAGDPFQIEPIVFEEKWIDENIYTMVNLLDFKNPQTQPCNFKIENLCTQYRSIPAIGDLFSRYAYGGLLKHERTSESQRKLIIDGLDVKTINYITFPVLQDSIFEAKKLSSSNVQVYSVLLVYESALYVARQIKKNQPTEKFKIGIICPYRAESELINKLWEQRTELFDNVEVNIGTIHGFQGDECDIILSVFNPPASGLVRASDKVFINRKNIMNVAISRARDYLFLFIPEKDYVFFDKLTEIKRVGRLAMQKKEMVRYLTSYEVEKVIFGDTSFIEENTFVTTHQMANVYSAPTQKYEVRIDDNSVDVQLQPKK